MLKKLFKNSLFIIICLNFFLFSNYTQAADIKMNPQITIDSSFQHTPCTGSNCSDVGQQVTANSIGKYIQLIYKYSIGTVGILATVVMMWGGFLWIVSAGNAERVGNAKSWIVSALSGLVLVLFSYTILYIVNPDLVKFNSLTISNPNKGETVKTVPTYTCSNQHPGTDSCRLGTCPSGQHCEVEGLSCGCINNKPADNTIPTKDCYSGETKLGEMTNDECTKRSGTWGYKTGLCLCINTSLQECINKGKLSKEDCIELCENLDYDASFNLYKDCTEAFN